jgi:DNA-binding NarL/FixJ family response regulator
MHLHEKPPDWKYQVLLGIAPGKSIKEIASDLTLSARTVSMYRAASSRRSE